MILLLIVAAHLVNASVPIFSQEIINQTVSVGKDAAFSCVVENLQGHRVAWIKTANKALLAIHDHVITNDKKVSVTHNDKDTWTLVIKTVDDKDAGFYMCQINSEPMLFKIAYLSVVSPPKIIDQKTSADLNVMESKQVELFCFADGTPMPSITWYKNNKAIGHNNSIFFGSISRDDAGQYICVAQNGVPPAQSKSISVFVNYKPEIISDNNIFGSPINSSIILNCTVRSHPRPVIYWTKGEDNVITSLNKKIEERKLNRKFESIIEIQKIQSEDFGTYTCIAKNTIGSTTETFSIIEIERLSSTTTLTSSTLLLSKKDIYPVPVTKKSILSNNSEKSYLTCLYLAIFPILYFLF